MKQRYSKLWKIFTGAERNKRILEYDSLAQDDLAKGITLGRDLVIPVCNDLYKVFIDENKIEGPNDENAFDEIVLVPEADPSQVCLWGGEFSASQIVDKCEPITREHHLVPMQIMASHDELEAPGIGRYLTSDYDLLMVGFFEGKDLGAPNPPHVPFKPLVGQATPEQ